MESRADRDRHNPIDGVVGILTAVASGVKSTFCRDAHGTFTESSKVMVTLTVFPGATSIGCGLGGFLLYMPREVPDGGGDCASQLPVGSWAALTNAGTL